MQNRSIYGGYMQEIDPYGEFAERIAKKGLTKSGYPQYDYAGFKKAFEAQAGDNMQNLRQLKSEILAALNLALATQNEKLEEALLNYQENLARLEQEYAGKDTSQQSRAIYFPQEAADEPVTYPLIVKQGEEEEIKNLDEFPNDGTVTNLILRRGENDSELVSVQNLSAPISGIAKAGLKLNSETDVVEMFESMGYAVEEVQHGKSREKALQIKDEEGNIVLRLYPYSDIRMKNGKYVFTERGVQKDTIRALMNDTSNSRRLAQIEEFADEILNNSAEISLEEMEIFLNNIAYFKNDEEVQYLMTELLTDEDFQNAYTAYMKERVEDINYQQSLKGNLTSGYYLIKDFFGGKADGGLSEQSLQNYEHNKQQENVSGVIYGQAVGPITNYKYGNSTMAKSGCAIIAVYNTMVLFGEQPDISEMILYFEQDGMVLEGYGGTNPYALENYLTAAGYSVENTTINLDDKLTDNNLVVLAFWNSDQSISAGVHTVVVQKAGDKIAVYNRSNIDTEAISYDSIHSYLTKGQNPPPKNARVLITAFVVEDKAGFE